MTDEENRRSAEAIEKIRQLPKPQAILWLASNRTTTEIKSLLALAQSQLGEGQDYITALLESIVEPSAQEILLKSANAEMNGSIFLKLAEVATEALKQRPSLVN